MKQKFSKTRVVDKFRSLQRQINNSPKKQTGMKLSKIIIIAVIGFVAFKTGIAKNLIDWAMGMLNMKKGDNSKVM